ncbi:MAG TPA: UDP-N-acetylmuramoyl-L-alanyl-D-glutamate--2,6-diaminopimelate ligase [Actinomycetota bacterium]|nr:UDP-N-acetylmuramoyl-L-alanyl-D-glutamate--2,6-diaminopimelate ligase [Actinomycetota bacterium]
MAPAPPRPLSDLLSGLPDVSVHGDASVAVSALCYRSDEATPGSVFFCVPGGMLDGHDFAPGAVALGAVALVVDRRLELEATQVLVPSVREAMGPISAAFFGRPAQAMTMIGVTGTNGKTTTTYLLEAVLRAAGRVPGVVGTTGVRVDGRPTPFPRTTPEAPDLQRLLADMAAAGVDGVAMEVSSHGLDQHRVDGVRYDRAVFTNLTQDHLDYHASMEEYFAAKARLFTPAMSDGAVVNHDSEEGRHLARSGLPTVTYGLDAGADVRATEVETTPRGLAFVVDGVRVTSPLRGLFNVENCLAAFATGRSLGFDDGATARAISSVRGVPGRVEAVEAGQSFLVMVDYAHTPDSVENVLRAARPLAAGRVIVVLGCGGDRDRAKRPLMGRTATANADLSVITSDNPRSEDPNAIIDEIVPGARQGGGAYLVEPDRRAAIRLAVSEARPGDVVVIAGKGHETYQELADGTIAFDDREVAAEEIRALGGDG